LENASTADEILPRTVSETRKIFYIAMREIEFAVPRDANLIDAERFIEKICLKHGLVLAMKDSLAAYPGCVHWHYKRQNQKGTLELTLFSQDRRVWVKVQEGRNAPWVQEELPGLQIAIELALKHGMC
jgi:hypothetical protein